MSDTKTSFERTILKGVTVELSGQAEADTPLYAINWFDTRLAAFYTFYGFFASRCYAKIGGRLVIKAKVGKIFAGDPKLGRRHLVIVRYPSPSSFLDLTSNRLFMVVSLFRDIAVKNFSFCFNKAPADTVIPLSNLSDRFYSVLTFEAGHEGGITTLAEEYGMEIHLSSRRILDLSIKKAGKATQKVPSVTHQVYIFSSRSEGAAREFFASSAFQALSDHWKGFYAAPLIRNQ